MVTHDISVEFTEEQKAVIDHQLPGHGRVLAGPGTGKSTTAAALARRLLDEDQPPRLKFLTFTRAATDELSKKLPAAIQASSLERPSTIHSFSLSILLQNPGCASFPQPLRIPDNYEFKKLIRQHLAQRNQVDVKKLDHLITEMAAKWESLDDSEDSHITPEERARFMGAWLQHRRIFGYTLIQELPDLFRCALRDNHDLHGVDYNLLIVDEYQDLNACDLEVLWRLAERGSSILAIGDDDQSIYSRRKAHPVAIRQFLEQHQTNNDYKLTICHRSPRRIIDWAQYVIQGDTGREDRNPPQCREDAPEGIVGLLNFKGDKSEARGVADIVLWLINTRRIPPSEILILSRTDRYGIFTKLIKEELGRRNIPISSSDEIEILLSENDNRCLLAILRFLVFRTDSLAWWSLINLRHGLGESFVNYVFGLANSNNSTFGEAFISAASTDFADAPPGTRNRAVSLWQEISSTLDGIQLPSENFEEETRWGQWIHDEIDTSRLPRCSDSLVDLLLGIDNVLEERENRVEIERSRELGYYLSQIQPLGKDLMRARSDGVRFMRMVGSKGLTVRATIVVGVDNDLIPRSGEDLNEERRLLYVAMTRSKEFLFLTWANRRRGPAARSSRENIGRRQSSDFLRGGPVESQDGPSFIRALS
ncbi:ATP-dependent helicase [bacterium]|nr:ATP-dependent helicase [bacterium]